jgi:hypothetical protein
MNINLTEYDVEIIMPVAKHYIYRITNTVSQKCYIGQTGDIKQRMENHLQGKGSKPLLRDIVKQGISYFEFEVLQILYEDGDIDTLEDQYIEQHNCLHPLGYNLRMNRMIEANDEEVDLNNFSIQGKYVFTNGIHKVFSIGEYSQSRSYQIVSNIKATVETSLVKQKKLFKFRYLELMIESDTDYVEGGIYTLNLKYKFNEDKFSLIIP